MSHLEQSKAQPPAQDSRAVAASGTPSRALLKFMVELGPLLVFFVANNRPELVQALIQPLFQAADFVPPEILLQKPIFMATLLFMGAMLCALVVSLIGLRHVPVMPLVSGAMVLVFGGLTLWFADDTFIKMKPTVVNLLFGSALLIGVAFDRPLLKIVLDTILQLDPQGWRILSWRWGCFFFVLALLNEWVWRTQTDAVWINFKVFGMMPLTLVFALAQTPLITRHQLAEPEGSGSDPA